MVFNRSDHHHHHPQVDYVCHRDNFVTEVPDGEEPFADRAEQAAEEGAEDGADGQDRSLTDKEGGGGGDILRFAYGTLDKFIEDFAKEKEKKKRRRG